MTDPDCICTPHPALPGIDSDERIDNKDCVKHHPENVIAKSIFVTVAADFTFEALDFYPDGVPRGIQASHVRDLLHKQGHRQFVE